MNRPTLDVQHLAVSFAREGAPKKPVRDITLEVGAGETLALVGESGSGKSLTALAAMRLLPSGGWISGGRILFKGEDLSALDPEEMRGVRGSGMGMIFQEPMSSLDPVYRVGFQLAEAIDPDRRLPRTEVEGRALELLTEVGVPEPGARLKSYPHQLSGGLRQRVMIACAIARNPALLIADEPTTALDVTVQAQIMALLDRLKARHSMAVLLITHDLGLVARHAQKVAVAYAGYTVETASVPDLFARPLHPYTRALMKTMPRLGVTGKLRTIPGNVPDPDRVPSGCPFRDRCELAIPRCAEKVPDPERSVPGRSVRCIRALE